MFMMCGYDFCEDINALNPSPLTTINYISTKLQNGIFDHWYVTRDVTSSYSPDEPTAWDYLTVMNANFEGSIAAGNLDYSLGEIDGFKVKRRKITDYQWVTIKYISISDFQDLSFSFNDNLTQSGVEYEYAFVPIISGVEGNYITNTIGSKFDGVFICDAETVYKFYAGVSYGTNQRVQKVGVFEPFGRKYPVVVSNGKLDYETGSVKGTVLSNDFLQTHTFDRLEMVKERDKLLDFLTNKKAKILKDWNGNFWMMIITNSPSVSFENNYGMGIADVSANWTEIGDGNKQSDLYSSGLVTEAN